MCVGCAYCYQDSRPDRRHASLADVAFIVEQAGKAGVFEVALGGGEVSEYPHFFEALDLFSRAGVIPNFTTRRTRWLARHWENLRQIVGGVAVSVNSTAEVKLLNTLIPQAERRSGQLVVQVVMGTVERQELRTLIQAAGETDIRVTLLGFKDVGRGQRFRPIPYEWWLEDLAEYVSHGRVSIDTALASEQPEILAQRLVPGSFHTEEGRFSAYVDAVQLTLAPSSYHAGPVHPFDDQWLDYFQQPSFSQGPSTCFPEASAGQLSRLRLGFATNSSSSHCLVLLQQPLPDEPPLQPYEDWSQVLWSWGPFTIASEAAKRHYLAANLFSCGVREERCLELSGLPPETSLADCYVNHQSVIHFQTTDHRDVKDEDEVRAVLEILLHEGVAVIGASDEGGPLYIEGKVPFLLLMEASFKEFLERRRAGR